LRHCPEKQQCLNPSLLCTFISFSQQRIANHSFAMKTCSLLHAELGSISKKLGCQPIISGSVEDHVHQLARFGRTITQAEWVKELKRVSNLWLKEKYVLVRI